MAHALPVPVHREVKFTSKRVAVLRLHDTDCCEILYRNEILTPVRYFPVMSCQRMRNHKRELAPGRRSPQYHVNTPFVTRLVHFMQIMVCQNGKEMYQNVCSAEHFSHLKEVFV